MPDDVLGRLRAANPIPDPDRLAVAGEAAEPVEPELRDVLDRARRSRAEENDDEILDRRRTSRSAQRPIPVVGRRDRWSTLAAAAAVLALVAGSVVWTATRPTTSGVDVLDEPAGEDAPVTFGADPRGTCTGDGETGFSVGPDGTVTGAPPPEESYTVDKSNDPLKARDVETLVTNRISIDEADLYVSRGSFVVRYRVSPFGPPPESRVWLQVWVRSADGSETGLIRAVVGDDGDPEVLAGSDVTDLRPIAGTVGQAAGRGAAAVDTNRSVDRVIFPTDALPVLTRPFLWSAEIRWLAGGIGDICPAGVDPTDPLSDPSVLARFPGDGTPPG